MVRLSPLARRLIPLVAFASMLAAMLVAADWWWADPPDATSTYVGREQCARCHAKEVEAWTGSDHDRAMAVATPQTVLGDFNDRRYTHFGTTSRMFRRGDQFLITTDGPDGREQTYSIKYTFGVRPLQQYLVEFPDGRVQCLPIAWDTERRQWFHLYPHEKLPAGDELHWTRPLQNWNYMCADCHSTNLQRNYDLKTNRYHTTFSEINVSCETCHGPGSQHVRLADAWSLFWDRRHGFGLPRLKDASNRVEIETCAPCHARRRIVYPGFRAGAKLLDYYLPEMLDSDYYWPDGQIRDEDYEYSSFVQSRMYHQNVRCSNCHDPHSMRVKFKEGPTIRDNRLCGQCHVPAKYDTPAHHHHPKADKPGTLCIECHMPKTPYMVIDPRLDHSIRVPRPELTVDLGIPNACNGCHHDKAKGETPQWAVEQVRTWYGPLKGPPHPAYAIAAGRQLKPEGLALLEAVVRRKDLSAMVRASALALLARYGNDAVEFLAAEALKDPEELVRAVVPRALEGCPPDRLKPHLTPALSDPIRAVRTEAARVLSAVLRVPGVQFAPAEREAFDRALAEYLAGQESVADQPAAHLNIAVIRTHQGRLQEAEQAYRTSLKIDPQFIPSRINLAMLYDQLDRKKEAEQELREAIRINPRYAEAHYSLGLLLAEQKGRLAEALASLTKAAELAPQNARIHYNRGLALQTLGRADEAEAALRKAFALAPTAPDYLYALATLYAQQQRWPRALACAEELVKLRPTDEEAQRFLAQLRRMAKP
jgi:tetratricopeptide (TPR) repeat protein